MHSKKKRFIIILFAILFVSDLCNVIKKLIESKDAVYNSFSVVYSIINNNVTIHFSLIYAIIVLITYFACNFFKN